MSTQVIVVTLHGDESSPLHCSVYVVVPFNHTGCIRNVAGGRLPPLRTRRRAIPFILRPGGFAALDGDESSPLHCVVPFNRTGCIRNVPGGRLPKKSWCDCHRQSIDFDSLRGAPPLRQCTTFSQLLRTQYRDRYVKNTVIRNKCIVGAAICRPGRCIYNLCG